MTKTASEVIHKAAEQFNFIARGETMDGNDYDTALALYTNFHGWGSREFPRTWSWSQDAVNDDYWMHVSMMFAAWLADVLHSSDSQREKALIASQRAERRFRQQTERRPTATVQISQV